jgi:hypothetical protein
VVENDVDLFVTKPEHRLYEYTREPTARQLAFRSRARRAAQPGVACRYTETRITPGAMLVVSGLVRRDHDRPDSSSVRGYRERPYRLVIDRAPNGYVISDSLALVKRPDSPLSSPGLPIG